MLTNGKNENFQIKQKKKKFNSFGHSNFFDKQSLMSARTGDEEFDDKKFMNERKETSVGKTEYSSGRKKSLEPSKKSLKSPQMNFLTERMNEMSIKMVKKG